MQPTPNGGYWLLVLSEAEALATGTEGVEACPLLLKVVSLSRHQHDMIMKFIILLLAIYLFYRYFLRPPKALPPQEPDLFVEHEEVKKEHEKNK